MSIEAKVRDGGLSKCDIVDLRRRVFLQPGLSLSALTLLAGCDISDTAPVDRFLRMISRINDGVQGSLFRPNKLARTFPESMVAKVFRFNAQYGADQVPIINPQTWRLELNGLVSDKRPWSLEQLQAIPQTSYVAHLFCVEGWSMIGKWGGVPLKSLLQRVGADLHAKYVAFRCDDPINYSSSIDMASALRPQTILFPNGEKSKTPPFNADHSLRVSDRFSG